MIAPDLFDTHAHLHFPEFAGDLDAVLERARAAGVRKILTIGTDVPTSRAAAAMAAREPDVWAAVGIHPHEAADADDAALAEIERLAGSLRVVAIGETGLDYFRLQGDLEWQRERFRVHIRASRASGKPLIIHTRAASADTIRIMQEEGAGTNAGGVGGVMHCFTESLEVAEAAMAMGFYISFSGIVTFKSAKDLQAVARAVPLERILIETDSPYLAPVPFRGRTNEPAYVKHVAEFLADLKGIPLAQVAQQTTDNFFKLFNIVR